MKRPRLTSGHPSAASISRRSDSDVGNDFCAAFERPEVARLRPFAKRVLGRVDHWRGGDRCGISVAAPFGSRCPTSRAMAPFPVAAHRTGQADLPHPALGQDACLRPRKVTRRSPEQQQEWRAPAVLLPRCPHATVNAATWAAFAPRIEIRVVPSLQHVVPSAVLAHRRSFVGSPQSPVRRRFQRQP